MHHTTQMIVNALDSTDTTMTTIIILMVTSLIMYRAMRFFNKPMVFGGVIAGVIISWLHLPKQYFDISSCGNMGEIGVNIYLMLLGAKIDFRVLKARRGTGLISMISALLPFGCGMLLAPAIYSYNKTPISLIEFSLIVGLCMSIASMSLISLFLNQTQLIEKSIGHLGILAAGADDLLFWLVYSGLLLILQKNEIIRYNALVTFVIYSGFLIFIAPRIVRYISEKIKSTLMMRAFMLCGCLISWFLALLSLDLCYREITQP